MNDDERELQRAEYIIKQRQIIVGIPKTAGRLATRVIGKYGVAAEQGNHDLQRAWEEAVGNQFNHLTQVGSCKSSRLEIMCRNSMVIQQLTFQKTKLIQDLNRIHPSAKIKELTFRMGIIN